MATVPNSHTFSDGVLTSSEMNTYIRDPIGFLLSRPVAELRQTVVQSIPNITFTSLLFDMEDLDNDPSGTGGHSTSVNTSRYTAVYPGWYLCSGGYSAALIATGNRGTRWAVNGSLVPASDSWGPGTAATNSTILARTKRIYLNVGDYVELQVYQASGGALNTVVLAEAASSMSIAFDRAA